MSLLKRLFGSSKMDESHPAFQAGQVIAASLIEGHDPNHIDAPEAQWLAAVSVSTETYVKERFLLRACACEVAARTKLYDPSESALVRGGIHHWFRFQSERSDLFRAVYGVYLQRLPRYLAAARKDSERGVVEPDEVRISEVGCTFADALTEASAGDELFRNICTPMALVFAPVYWEPQFGASLAWYCQVGLKVANQ